MDTRILVVDDHPVNRKILSAMLLREGFAVLEAEDGVKALETAKAELPDLILLDVMMPNMDGISACRELRQLPAFEDTPIMFLSAVTETMEKVKGLEAGAQDYITKPFHQVEVIARVKNVLSHYRKDRRRKRTLELTEQVADRLQEEIDEAAKVQESLLPPSKLDGPCKIAWKRHVPAGHSPETFGFLRLDENHLAAFLFDVGGDGLARAISAISLGRLLNHRAGSLLRPKIPNMPGFRPALPAEVLDQLDHSMGFAELDPLFNIRYLLFDIQARILKYAVVGSPDAICLHGDGSTSWLRGSRPSEGKAFGGRFMQGEASLKKGDRIFLVSDGLTQVRNQEGMALGEARVELLLRGKQGESLEDQVEALHHTAMGHAAKGQVPDSFSILAMSWES